MSWTPWSPRGEWPIAIEPGKYADLLVVEGNRLKNLRVFQNTANLHAIVKGGVFVKRAL